MLINCIVCNEEFEAMRKDKKCCSIRCSKKNNYLNNRDYYIKNLQENRQKNKEGYKKWRKEYYQKNKDKDKEQRKEYFIKYYQENKDKYKEREALRDRSGRCQKGYYQKEYY